MRSPYHENRAQVAAYRARDALGIPKDASPEVALILGTGWGDTLEMKVEAEAPLKQLPGFEKLGSLDGHRRMLSYGRIAGRPAVALRGRIHLNESHDPDHWMMVRLQAEMLVKLGARRLILTNAAGSLSPRVRVGDIVLADGFLLAFAPPLPLVGGEFVSPEDAIDRDFVDGAFDASSDLCGLVKRGGYAMLRGPAFEGRRYDKALLASSGASVVGMSTVPEAAVAALYAEDGVRVVPVSYVTNSAHEDHSHEENCRRAKADAPRLGSFLTGIVRDLPVPAPSL
jgi:purine-nucleoside phosphorylase